MPSNLFNAIGPGRPNQQLSMISQIRQFAQGLNGDPRQQVQQLLNSGRMSQQQFNELSAKAQQLMPFFK